MTQKPPQTYLEHIRTLVEQDISKEDLLDVLDVYIFWETRHREANLKHQAELEEQKLDLLRKICDL